jgi:hypothetical protein
MQRALNTIQMQGHSDDEIEDPLAENINLVLPAAPVEQQNILLPPDQDQLEDQVMNISAAAYNGLPSASTISLLLALHKTTAIALADTGSTNTFMDSAFARKYNIPLTTTKP